VLKRVLTMVICVVFFISGFVISKYYTLENESHEESPKITDNTDVEKNNEKDVFPNLTESEIEFLEKHLFGQWRFSERLYSLDESSNNRYNTTYNISDIGVEELKKYLVIAYEKDWIDFPVRMQQTTFSNARDMFLFGRNGGFYSIRNPVYSIEKMDSNVIDLSNVYTLGSGKNKIEFLGAENFIKISCLVRNEENMSRQIGEVFLNTIYIDPNDVNTIYADFCGLWKMERDQANYNTGTKSELW